MSLMLVISKEEREWDGMEWDGVGWSGGGVGGGGEESTTRVSFWNRVAQHAHVITMCTAVPQ